MQCSGFFQGEGIQMMFHMGPDFPFRVKRFRIVVEDPLQFVEFLLVVLPPGNRFPDRFRAVEFRVDFFVKSGTHAAGYGFKVQYVDGTSVDHTCLL
jgi:hypothetical protein